MGCFYVLETSSNTVVSFVSGLLDTVKYHFQGMLGMLVCSHKT